jgi:hypothetical protein
MPAAVPQSYPIETISALLGISTRRIRQLVAAGVIPRTERGRYPLVGSIQGYIRLLRDRAVIGDVGDSPRDRLTTARAVLAEHKLAQRRAEVVDVALVEAAVQRLRTGIGAMLGPVSARYGARVCPEHPQRGEAALRRVVREVLVELEAFELRADDVPIPVEEAAAPEETEAA